MYTTALAAIIDADLPPATERLATRLLLLADDATGQINLTLDAYLTLSHCSSLSSARKHLTALSAAGVIHYSTNDHVYITFRAWQPRADISACTRPNERAHAPNLDAGSPPPAPPTPAPARPRAETSAPARPAHRLPHTHVLEEEEQSTQPPTDTNLLPLPPCFHNDVRFAGVRPQQLRVHPDLDDDHIRAIIHNWRAENAVGAAGVGALIYRLRHTWTHQPDPRIIRPPTPRKDYSKGLPPGYEDELRRHNQSPGDYHAHP